MTLKLVLNTVFEASKLVSTKALLLKHDFRSRFSAKIAGTFAFCNLDLKMRSDSLRLRFLGC